jgi:SAM-dependent methyltransferase
MRASNLRERFDLIMHFFVLEHISSPLDFLNQQLEILNPGGIIVFEIPNVADPLFALYDVPDFERFYWSVAHPWYFSVKSLDYLLSKLDCHYTITLEQRYDLSNHIIWARDGRPGGMGRFNKVFDHEFNEKYKETLIRSGFCDTLICTIRKPQED